MRKDIMQKIALVMGKQGSGKTTRICREFEKCHGFWNRAYRFLFCPDSIHVLSNYYNHISLDHDGRLVFITGIIQGRSVHRLSDLHEQNYIIEFPHSGYIPPNANVLFNTARIRTNIFAIELPEIEWRGIGGSTGLITSPRHFMEQGPGIAPRQECDYKSEIARIRNDIALSNVPASFYESAEPIIKSIRKFFGFRFKKHRF